MQCGRVGRRLLSMKSLRFRKISEAFLFSSHGSFSSPLVFSSRWILVCHADFADDADFFSLIILVPQISRIHTDFFHWLFKFHRFHGFPQIFFIHYFSHGFTWIFSGSLLSLSFLLFFCHFFISQILDLSVWEDDADFWFHELDKDYADFSNSLFFLLSIHWFLYIINLLIRHFSDLYFFTSFVLFPYFFTSSFL